MRHLEASAKGHGVHFPSLLLALGLPLVSAGGGDQCFGGRSRRLDPVPRPGVEASGLLSEVGGRESM